MCGAINTIFAHTITIDNQTHYPRKTSSERLMVQWAFTAESLHQENNTTPSTLSIDSKMLQSLNQKGVLELTTPDRAQYFRILLWSPLKKQPDLLTHWVTLIPNKKYTVMNAHLMPLIMLSGLGC